MKRFKNILLLANQGTGDQAILRRAASLAETNRAQLVVVDVIEELPHDMQKLIVVITPMELQKSVTQERQKQLERVVAPIRKEGLRVGVNVLTGTPFLEIIRQVLRQKHDLVIMAAEGRSGLKGRLFGSTSLHLMRKCPCPVWVMKSDPARTLPSDPGGRGSFVCRGREEPAQYQNHGPGDFAGENGEKRTAHRACLEFSGRTTIAGSRQDVTTKRSIS